MDLVIFVVQLLNAVQYGLVLFLVASGLTLVFGIMGVINLAHGTFYMLGAYIAFWISAYTGSFWLALAGGVAIAFALGLAARGDLRQASLRPRPPRRRCCSASALILVFEEMRTSCSATTCTASRRRPSLHGSIPLTDVLSYPVYRLASARSASWSRRRSSSSSSDPHRHDDPRRRENRDMVRALGIDIRSRLPLCLRGRRRAGGARRHDRRADLVGVSRAWATRC